MKRLPVNWNKTENAQREREREREITTASTTSLKYCRHCTDEEEEPQRRVKGTTV
jgi:hypothetical protein